MNYKQIQDVVNDQMYNLLYFLNFNKKQQVKPLEVLTYLYTDKYIKQTIPGSVKDRFSARKFMEELMEEHLRKAIDEKTTELIEQGASRTEVINELKNCDCCDVFFEYECPKQTQKIVEKIFSKIMNEKVLQQPSFYEKVQEYTNNFQFLANNVMVYLAENGYCTSVKKKFDNLEDYMKFNMLHNRVRLYMKNGLSEMEAIDQMLKDNQKINETSKGISETSEKGTIQAKKTTAILKNGIKAVNVNNTNNKNKTTERFAELDKDLIQILESRKKVLAKKLESNKIYTRSEK